MKRDIAPYKNSVYKLLRNPDHTRLALYDSPADHEVFGCGQGSQQRIIDPLGDALLCDPNTCLLLVLVEWQRLRCSGPEPGRVSYSYR